MEPHEPTPFFSIVIPTLNEEEYLPQLLLDLSDQTFPDFEIIIVDAKSEDRTSQRARQFREKFARLTILESDQKNVSVQRNLGAQQAIADWLIFLDADNRLPGHFLQGIKQWAEVQRPDFLSTWFEPDSTDIKDKAIAVIINLTVEFSRKSRSPLLREAFVCANKRAFLDLGGFDESTPFREGSDLLKRAYARDMSFLFRRDPKFVYSYRRLRRQGILRSLRNTLLIELARWIHYTIPEETSRNLYPMEGGRSFRLSAPKQAGTKRFANKFRNPTRFPARPGERVFYTDVVRRIFKSLADQSESSI